MANARRAMSRSPDAPAKRGPARSPLSRRIPRLKSGFPAEPGQRGVQAEARSGGPGGGRSDCAVQGGTLGEGSSRRRPPRTPRPRQAPRAQPSGTGLPQAPRLLPTPPGAAEWPVRLRAHLVAGTRNPLSGSPTSPASADGTKPKVKPRRRRHFSASANPCSRGYGGPRGQKSPAWRQRANRGAQAKSVLQG